MQQKKKNDVWIFLMLFGLIFCTVVTSIYFNEVNKTQDMEKIPAVISRTEHRRTGTGSEARTRYNTWVTYEYQGKLYEDVHLNASGSSYKEGKSIDIMVDPMNPEFIRANLNSTGKLLSLLMTIGLILMLFGLYQLLLNKAGKSKWVAKQDGTVQIEADLKGTKNKLGCFFFVFSILLFFVAYSILSPVAYMAFAIVYIVVVFAFMLWRGLEAG